MTDMLVKLLEQLPSTAAVIFVVILFLKHLRSREISTERAYREVVDRNTRAMDRSTNANNELTMVIKSFTAK